MNMSSLKLKITLWYVLAMVFVSIAVFTIMNSINVRHMEESMEMRVTQGVDGLTKRLLSQWGDVARLRVFELFHEGVQMMVYDGEENLLAGTPPFDGSEPLAFEENHVRRQEYSGNEYYEFDRRITVSPGRSLWVKGVLPAGNGGAAAREIAKYNLAFILVMILIAAGGGYYITSRTLSPVSKIQSTAQSIIESKDLKQRIEIGEGAGEFHSLANTFDRMLDEIEGVVEREQQFISDASHELRTPVAVIRSECDYMERYAGTVEEMRESAESIRRQSEKMSTLIAELLAISRMERDSQPLELEETDLSELAELICEEQRQIQPPGISLEMAITPGVTAVADRIMISRLFMNLISNAYKYNKPGGKIVVFLSETAEAVTFSVEDSGIGIAEEDIPKIWERFFRVDAARTSDGQESMGLGLSMVKWIAQKHRGTVAVQSVLGLGSKFTFAFPKR